MLIHGLFGSADTWEELAPLSELATEWHLIAIDLRGHGASAKPHGPGEYGHTLANDVIAVLDNLGVRQAHVLGYSYGGLVACALLASNPDRLRSVILGGASRVRPGVHRDVAWADTLAAALEGGGGAQWLAQALAGGDADQDAEQTELIERRMAGADLAAVAALLRATRDLAVSDTILRANSVPVLGLVGARDPNRSDMAAMATLTRRMEVVEIPGADHVAAPRSSIFWRSVEQWLKARSETGG